jgi:hypothetical protein
MKNYLFVLLFLNCQVVFSQKNIDYKNKLDSVFNNYLNFLINEDSTIIYKSDDTLCQYWEKRILIIDFFENITGIFLERKPGVGNEGICRIETRDDYKKWEDWYNKERDSLIWVNDNQRINSSEVGSSRYIDYARFYPNNIRFVWKPDEIPKSPPPKYIQEMIENLRPKLRPLPAKVVAKPSQ